MMSVLCTMTGVLGISGKFPTGPPGGIWQDQTPMQNDAKPWQDQLIQLARSRSILK